MNLTANVWRTSLLCSALTLCVSSSSFVSPAAYAESTAPTATEAAAEAATTEATTDKVLIPAAKGGIGLTVREGKSTDQITIGQNLKDGDYSVQRLHTPERIVVDLFNQS